jgi:hypothetical protein
MTALPGPGRPLGLRVVLFAHRCGDLLIAGNRRSICQGRQLSTSDFCSPDRRAADTEADEIQFSHTVRSVEMARNIATSVLVSRLYRRGRTARLAALQDGLCRLVLGARFRRQLD